MFRISFYQVLYFGFFNVHIFEIPFSVRKKKNNETVWRIRHQSRTAFLIYNRPLMCNGRLASGPSLIYRHIRLSVANA